VARGVRQCCEQAAALITQAVDSRVCVEAFVEHGREFTAIVLQGRNGPVTLVPTEVRHRIAQWTCEREVGSLTPAAHSLFAR
jgi:formate-dependent phosphoribosylglycinamide formyltransferase (GAR transformylase)